MKSTLFLASLMSTPWALQPDVLHAYAMVIARQYGDKFTADSGVERPIQARTISAAARPGSSNRTRGSIGVIVAHEDMSKMFEAEGVAVTLITAGKYKAEGNPYAPLDAEARAAIQADVDAYGADFTNAVARGRGVSVDAVRKTMGQGRMLRGSAAQAASMVDGIATFDEVIRRMQASAQRPAAASAGAFGSPAIERNRAQLAGLADGPGMQAGADAAAAIRHRHRTCLLELISS